MGGLSPTLTPSPAGDITSRVTADTEAASEALSEKLSLLMWCGARGAFLYILMLRLSLRLAICTAVGLPLILLVPKFSGKLHQVPRTPTAQCPLLLLVLGSSKPLPPRTGRQPGHPSTHPPPHSSSHLTIYSCFHPYIHPPHPRGAALP